MVEPTSSCAASLPPIPDAGLDDTIARLRAASETYRARISALESAKPDAEIDSVAAVVHDDEAKRIADRLEKIVKAIRDGN